ncbi:MAG: DNA polymerase III subunit delta, partial [Bacteroidaceae bacterium]
MAKTTTGVTYESVIRDIKAQNFKPIYYLMGVESFYIDKISDFIVEKALAEEERDFSLINMYGADVDISTIINTAKSFPMGGSRQVVMVREVQNVEGIESLAFYLQHPQPSTILVLCHKNGLLDRRTKLAAMIERVGVLFESKKQSEHQLLSFVSSYLKQHQISIDVKASAMMVDFIGPNLSRMIGELDKLIITLSSKTQKNITPELVETNIGISKEFNNFELQNALVEKDVFKANQIILFFEKNPKANPIQMTLALLFKFYSNLMIAYYAPDKSPNGIAAWLGLSPWQVEKNILPAMRKFSGVKVMQIIDQIRRTDAKSKGV